MTSQAGSLVCTSLTDVQLTQVQDSGNGASMRNYDTNT